MRGTSVNNSVPSCQSLAGPHRKPSQRGDVFRRIKMVHNSAAVHWSPGVMLAPLWTSEIVRTQNLLALTNYFPAQIMDIHGLWVSAA